MTKNASTWIRSRDSGIENTSPYSLSYTSKPFQEDSNRRVQFKNIDIFKWAKFEIKKNPKIVKFQISKLINVENSRFFQKMSLGKNNKNVQRQMKLVGVQGAASACSHRYYCDNNEPTKRKKVKFTSAAVSFGLDLLNFTISSTLISQFS